MIDKKIAIRYAKALFLLAESNSANLESLLDELKNVESIVDETPGLKTFLTAPVIPIKRKMVVLKTLTLGISPVLRNFLSYLLRKNRFSIIDTVAEEFEKLVNEKIGKITGTVVSARELTEKEKEKLKETFEEKLNKTIEFEFTVDGSLIGGIVVTIGDIVYNGSLKNYLTKLDMRLSRLVLR